MERLLEESLFVAKNGFISRWGTIKLLSLKVEENYDEWAGSEQFNDKLLRYSNGSYVADMSPSRHSIIIFDKKYVEVNSLALDSLFFVCTNTRSKIYIGGWVLSPSVLGQTLTKEYLKNFLEAEKGIKPTFFDNGTFIKVSDKKYVGQNVRELEIGINN